MTDMETWVLTFLECKDKELAGNTLAFLDWLLERGHQKVKWLRGKSDKTLDYATMRSKTHDNWNSLARKWPMQSKMEIQIALALEVMWKAMDTLITGGVFNQRLWWQLYCPPEFPLPRFLENRMIAFHYRAILLAEFARKCKRCRGDKTIRARGHGHVVGPCPVCNGRGWEVRTT